MSEFYRRELPLYTTLIVGIIVIIDYFITFSPLQTVASSLYTWATIIASVAIILGLVSLTLYHLHRLYKRTSGWQYSVVTIVTIIVVMVLGLWLSPQSSVYNWLYLNLFAPVLASVNALLAFYIISAAYRAFRARTLDATLLLLAAILVMLRNAPIGNVIWVGFPVIGDWIMNIPNSAGFRGIMLGAAIGAIALGIRTLTGRERGYLGGSTD